MLLAVVCLPIIGYVNPNVPDGPVCRARDAAPTPLTGTLATMAPKALSSGEYRQAGTIRAGTTKEMMLSGEIADGKTKVALGLHPRVKGLRRELARSTVRTDR